MPHIIEAQREQNILDLADYWNSAIDIIAPESDLQKAQIGEVSIGSWLDAIRERIFLGIYRFSSCYGNTNEFVFDPDGEKLVRPLSDIDLGILEKYQHLSEDPILAVILIEIAELANETINYNGEDLTVTIGTREDNRDIAFDPGLQPYEVFIEICRELLYRDPNRVHELLPPQ